ncbi:MAG: glycosyltransferase family 4 protein [Pseudomonadota bacterium]
MTARRIVVINDISRAAGGATGLALLSARLLRERGRDVTYLTGDDAANPLFAQAGIVAHGLGQQRLRSASRLSKMVRGVYNSAARDFLSGWIRDNDDLNTSYHLHGWSQIFSPAIFDALRPVMHRLIISAHDFFLVCPNGAYANFQRAEVCALTPMSVGCMATHCDRRSYFEKLWRVARHASLSLRYEVSDTPPILAIHKGMRPLLRRGGAPDAAIVDFPNPVTAFRPTRVEAERNKTILFVGRVDETKGVDLACAAASRIGARLRVIGDGPMAPRLRAAYPDVDFVGFQEPAAIGDFVADARVLVMPSRYPEPFGLVAVEALWSGLPVVAPHSALLAGDIEAAQSGMTVDPRDVDAFGAALQRLLTDDALTERMSLNAFSKTRHIAQTPDDWADGLLRRYDACCA